MTTTTAPFDDSRYLAGSGEALDAPVFTGSVTVTGARVTQAPGRAAVRDLVVTDGRFAPVPDGVRHLPGDGVLRADGAYAVPLRVDTAVASRPRSRRQQYDLVPGNRATFALVRRPVGEYQLRRMLVVDPADLLAVFVSGHLEVWDGRPTRPAGRDLVDLATHTTWVGTWVDRRQKLRQRLGVDGRYTETRGRHVDAYTGSYWVREDRISYLDDSGFWAFGELVDDTLHHAGFVMTQP